MISFVRLNGAKQSAVVHVILFWFLFYNTFLNNQQEWQMDLYEERIEQFADEWNITWETDELIDDDGIEII